MNYQVLHMLEQAGFKFTPDVMHKLPLFEKLVKLEREACAKLCENAHWSLDDRAEYAAAIRARGQS